MSSMQDKIKYAFYVYVAIVLHNVISFMSMGLVGSSLYDFSKFIKATVTFITPETVAIIFVPFSGLFSATIWFFVGLFTGSNGFYYYFLFNLIWVYFANYIFDRIKDRLNGVKSIKFVTGFFDYSRKLFFQLLGFIVVIETLSLAYETFFLKQKPNSSLILLLFVFSSVWALLWYFRYKK